MSTRHSFLSTTGLVRPSSSMSTASIPESYVPQHPVHSGGTRFERRTTARSPPQAQERPLIIKAGIIPLRPAFIVRLAVVLSIMFVLVTTCAFIPDDGQALGFADMLDDVAANTPGVVLIGDDVDVDVDEPSVGIRWSIIACGQAYILPGSEGTHGSQNCGLPAMSLQIFVDGNNGSSATYNPSILPVFNGSGQRHSIQNMFQFDDDHVLDVHEARLYPFDTYKLTSTFRAFSVSDNTTVPIQRLATISLTSSFVSISSDSATSVAASDGTQMPTRDLVLQVFRPAEARAFALLLFAASWMLAHATVGLIALSWNVEEAEKVLKHLVSTFVVTLLIPQLRKTMPDAPGFDGVLIDAIGFFPQMLVCGASAIILFMMTVRRELTSLDNMPVKSEDRKEAPAPLSTGLMRMRRGGSSFDISHVRNLSRTFSGLGLGSGSRR